MVLSMSDIVVVSQIQCLHFVETVRRETLQISDAIEEVQMAELGRR
jgi:hypothetical protein